MLDYAEIIMLHQAFTQPRTYTFWILRMSEDCDIFKHRLITSNHSIKMNSLDHTIQQSILLWGSEKAFRELS
jgi:hypothetical protein